ncbi:MAG: hypothetical protein AAF628_27755 [Planctomycetota bacterium]
MNPFTDLLNDRVTLINSAGETIRPDIPAVVDSRTGQIIIFEVTLPLEEGDVFERRLPAGGVERYEVVDPGYQAGLNRIPASYQARVRRVSDKPRESPPPAVTNYHLYGANARVNQGSVDVSTNTATTVNVDWERLRVAIRDGVADEPERAHIAQKVEEMHDAVGKPSFKERYQEFMALAANHMAVLGPSIGPLTSLL